MMTDTIQERLRDVGPTVCNEAADRIDALEKALRWYETEVRLFATDATDRADWADELLDQDGGKIARAVLPPKHPDHADTPL